MADNYTWSKMIAMDLEMHVELPLKNPTGSGFGLAV